MKRSLNKYLLILLLVSSNYIFSQEIEIENLIEIIINQNMNDEKDNIIDIALLQSELERLQQHPININSNDFEIFLRIGILTSNQYSAIQDHIKNYGQLLAIEELQQIRALDISLIKNLKPFISFNGISEIKTILTDNIVKESKKDLTIHYQRTVQKITAYMGPEPIYLGDPSRIMIKFSSRFYKRWKFGLNLEKDAGERFNWKIKEKKVGFDHVSAYLNYNGKGLIKSIIIGDFQVGFAQGLCYWRGFSFGKSSSSVPIRKIAFGIRPHTGMDEINYLRGLGIKIGNDRIQNTSFVSYRSLDAIPLDSTLSSYRSILTSGYHRSALEINYASSLVEISWGNHFTYSLSNLDVGFTYAHQLLQNDLSAKKELYAFHYFSGKENYTFGMNADLTFNNAHLFAEVSRSANGSVAYLIASVITLDPRFSFSVLHRNYPTNYQAISSSAFGEASRNQNEKGIYFGIEFKLSRKTLINAYVDLYQFPWIRSAAVSPTIGNEWLFKITHKSTKRLISSFQYRYEKDELKIPGIIANSSRTRHRLRIQNEHSINSSIKLRYRLELHYLAFIEKRSGYLFYTDLIIQSPDKPYTISLRYALFNTDDYTSRIYAYERDAYFSYSIKPYFNRGQKVYLLAKWSMNRLFTFVFRIAHSRFPYQSTIGSSNDLIEGNQRTDLTFQLRMRW